MSNTRARRPSNAVSSPGAQRQDDDLLGLSGRRVPSPAELCEIARQSPDQHTPWEAAFHEAGHVVAHMGVGGAPLVVWLADGELAGRTVFSHGPTFSRTLPAIRRDRAVILAAGDCAWGIALGQAEAPEDWAGQVVGALGDPENTDMEKLAQLIPRQVTCAEAKQWLAGARADAGRILEDRWDDVQLVAAELHARRHLEREDLRALGLAERTHVHDLEGTLRARRCARS